MWTLEDQSNYMYMTTGNKRFWARQKTIQREIFFRIIVSLLLGSHTINYYTKEYGGMN